MATLFLPNRGGAIFHVHDKKETSKAMNSHADNMNVYLPDFFIRKYFGPFN